MLLPLLSPPFLAGNGKVSRLLVCNSVLSAGKSTEKPETLPAAHVFTEQIRQTLPAVELFYLLYILYNTYQHDSQVFHERRKRCRHDPTAPVILRLSYI
jgi:hypothetical protein